jgi:hypothetical protein
MLSARLVTLIESNSGVIAGRLVNAVKQHPDMVRLAGRPDSEIRDWCLEILQNIGYLLAAPKEQDGQRRFEILGRARFAEEVPLAEAVLRLILLKGKILDFIGEQGFDMNALQIYAEEELERRLGRFFDDSLYHLVRGYEKARLGAVRMAG